MYEVDRVLGMMCIAAASLWAQDDEVLTVWDAMPLHGRAEYFDQKTNTKK